MRKDARGRIVGRVCDSAEGARDIVPIRLAIRIRFHVIVELVAALAHVVQLGFGVHTTQPLAIGIATTRYHVQLIALGNGVISTEFGDIDRRVRERFDRTTRDRLTCDESSLVVCTGAANTRCDLNRGYLGIHRGYSRFECSHSNTNKRASLSGGKTHW